MRCRKKRFLLQCRRCKNFRGRQVRSHHRAAKHYQPLERRGSKKNFAATSIYTAPRTDYESTYTKPPYSRKEEQYSVNTRGGGLNFGSGILPDDLKILCDDLQQNYSGKIFGGYQVTKVGAGTFESILERLGKFNRTKIVYLIVEEKDG